MPKLRRTLTALMTATVLLAGPVLVAAPAHAALPGCNGHDRNEGNLGVAAYVSGSTIDRRCYLAQGARGEGVRLLQRSLNRCYGAGLTVDGSFGPATRTALINTQRAHGLAQDGSYGPLTRNAMNHEYLANGSGAASCMKVRIPA